MWIRTQREDLVNLDKLFLIYWRYDKDKRKYYVYADLSLCISNEEVRVLNREILLAEFNAKDDALEYINQLEKKINKNEQE